MKKRKFLAVLLALVMTLSLLPTAALAAVSESLQEGTSVASVSDQDGTKYYYYDSLAEAVENANSGDIVHLLKDVTVSSRISLKKSITIDGSAEGMPGKNGEGCYKITGTEANTNSSDGRIFDVDGGVSNENMTITLKNVKMETSAKRGISVWGTSGMTLNLQNVFMKASYYTTNIASGNTDIVVNITDSYVQGWCAFQLWSPATVNVRGSTLVGLNDKGYNKDGWNDYAAIVINQDCTYAKVNVSNTTVIAQTTNGNVQRIVNIQDVLNTGEQDIPVGNVVAFDNCSFRAEGSIKFEDGSMEKLTPLYYSEGGNSISLDGKNMYVPEEIEDWIDNEPLDPVVVINDVYFGQLTTAVSAAQDEDTVILLKDVKDIKDYLRIEDGKKIIVNLNEHNVSFKAGKFFFVCNGTLNLTGSGKVYEQSPYYGPVLMKGSTTDQANYSAVNVGKDVILEGWAGLFMDNREVDGENYGYGMVANVEGTLIGKNDGSDDGYGLYLNGSVAHTTGNVPSITIASTAKLTGDGAAWGIY